MLRFEIEKLFFIIFAILYCFAVNFLPSSINPFYIVFLNQIIIFWLFRIVNYDFSHPAMCVLIPVYIYGFYFIIWYYFMGDLYSFRVISVTKLTSIYFTSTAILLSLVKNRCFDVKGFRSKFTSFGTLKLVYFLFLGISYSYFVYCLSFSSKSSIMLDWLHDLIWFSLVSVLIYLMLYWKCFISGRRIPKIYTICLFANIFGSLVFAGNRTPLVFFIMSCLILLFISRPWKTKRHNLRLIRRILPVLLVSFLFILFSGIFKPGSSGFENASSHLYQNEFIVAGRNFTNILSSKVFETNSVYFDDLYALFGITHSTTAKYNAYYYPECKVLGCGKGFSLIAESYLSFGVLGLILVPILIYFPLIFIYMRLGKGAELYPVIYCWMVCIYAFALRSDLFSLISPLIKQVLFLICFLWVVDKINIFKRSNLV